MKVLLSTLCSVILVWEQIHCQPSFGDFIEKIPDQISTAWNNFLNVLRQPVKPKRLGTTGKLKWQYRITTEPMKPSTPNKNLHKAWKPALKPLSETSTHKTKTTSDFPEIWRPVITKVTTKTTVKPKVTVPRIKFFYSTTYHNSSTTFKPIINPRLAYSSLMSDTMNLLRDRLNAVGSNHEIPKYTTTEAQNLQSLLLVPVVENPDPDIEKAKNEFQSHAHKHKVNKLEHAKPYRIIKYVYVEENSTPKKSTVNNNKVVQTFVPFLDFIKLKTYEKHPNVAYRYKRAPK